MANRLRESTSVAELWRWEGGLVFSTLTPTDCARHSAVDLLLRGFAPCCVAMQLGHETETVVRHYLPFVRELLDALVAKKKGGL